MTTLGQLLIDAQPGFACGAEDPTGLFQFRMHNVSKSSAIELNKRRRVPLSAHRRMDRFYVHADDVLFNATNSPDNVGKSILVPALDEAAVFSNHFIRLRPKPKVLDPAFLWRWLQWQFQLGIFQSMCRQWVNQATVSRESLLALHIEKPLFPEQRRVAAILDHADALRAKRRQVIADLDDLERSIFLDMFGNPHDWPNRWPMGTIGDMADDVQYGTSARAGDAGKWPIVRMGNVTDDGRLDLTDLKWIDLSDSDIPKFTLRRGDLLFNRTNSKEKVGKTCVVLSDEPLAFAGYLVRVRLTPEHRVEFVNAFMTSPYGQALRRGMAKAAVNQANINATEMQSIPIALPPKDIQQEFAAAISQIGCQRERQVAALAELDALFASLQSHAFRGEL